MAAIAPVKVEAPVTPSVPLAVKLVNAPVEGVVAPIVVLFTVEPVIATPLSVPPVIATALAFWVDIVPNPVMSVLGIVGLAVMALVPLPYTYPVRVIAPVPPFATFNVPPSVIAPEVAPTGVNPVVPALKVVTPPDSENCLHEPAA